MRGHWFADFRQDNMAINRIVCSLVLLVSGVLALDIDSDVAKQVTNSMHKYIFKLSKILKTHLYWISRDVPCIACAKSREIDS